MPFRLSRTDVNNPQFLDIRCVVALFMLVPPAPEHGTRPSLFEKIVVGPGGAIGGILALELESEPLQSRAIARKMCGDIHTGATGANLKRRKRKPKATEPTGDAG
jgi:hypothetical protein